MMFVKKGISRERIFTFFIVIVVILLGIGIFGLFNQDTPLTSFTVLSMDENSSEVFAFLIMGTVGLLVVIVCLSIWKVKRDEKIKTSPK